jgi:hypothetical protein
MIYFIDNIADSIKQYLPMADRGIYLARIDDEGRVLMPSPNDPNEYVYAGIRDNDSNYFYIRHRDSGEISYSQPSSLKSFACGQTSTLAKYELRVVASIRNWCPYNMEESIRKALMMAYLPDIKGGNSGSDYIKNASISLVRSQIDSRAILSEESPKPKQFDKSLIFVAVDFDLEFEITYF